MVGVGNLGSYFIPLANRQPDLHVVTVVDIPKTERRLEVQQLREDYPETEFTFGDGGVKLIIESRQEVAVFMDATYRNAKELEEYVGLGKPVILQSSQRNLGTLSVPPKVPYAPKDIYRMGDCNVVGATPVISALGRYIKDLEIDVQMGEGRIPDILRDTRGTATTIANPDNLQQDLRGLFPDIDISVGSITLTPMKRLYLHYYRLHLKKPLRKDELLQILADTPRIAPLQESSLYVAVDSRVVTSMSNADLVRIIGHGTEPVTSMRLTDTYLGLRR